MSSSISCVSSSLIFLGDGKRLLLMQSEQFQSSSSKEVRPTRRTILTVGLLLILAGFFLLNQGTQVLIPIAEQVGLVSHVQTETAVIAPTLVSVAPSNFSFLSFDLGSNVQVQGSLQVGDSREIAFYIMNEGNFSEWRLGHPSAIILAKPAAISYNFTFTPKAAGTYYFVFDNQDTSRRAVILNLDLIKDSLVLSPFLGYLAYELIAVGILLSALGLRLGRKKRKSEAPATTRWKCKFCKAENSGELTFCSECGKSQK